MCSTRPALMGLGFGPDLPETTTTTTTDKKSLTDTISAWLGIGQQAINTYHTIKNSTGGSGNYVNTPPPPPPAEDPTKKILQYGLYAGGAIIVSYGVYQLLKPKGKKK